MVENKEVNLNINEVSRMQQQIEKKKADIFGSMVFSVLAFLFAFFLYWNEFANSWIIILGVVFLFYSLILFIQLEDMKSELETVSVDEKENNFMKKIEFQSAEDAIKDLVISKELIYQPEMRSKGDPKDHKLILDHENCNLYYIVLDATDKKESIRYRKVPYAEIVQAAVIADEVIISKSSLASKVGGTVVGGVLAGGVGAIVGGSNTKKSSSKAIEEIELRIVVNDIEDPTISIRLNELPIKKPVKIKEVRNLADEWKTTIDLIIKEENKTPATSPKVEQDKIVRKPEWEQKEKIEMLKDLAELKASGAITEDDFNELKQGVLDR